MHDDYIDNGHWKVSLLVAYVPVSVVFWAKSAHGVAVVYSSTVADTRDTKVTVCNLHRIR